MLKGLVSMEARTVADQGGERVMLEEPEELKRRLELISAEVRMDIVKMTGLAESGHPGGSLSCVEIVVSLFCHHMRHDPKNPSWEHRDRFVLSKGHAAPTLYSVLSRCGYFEREELWRLRQLGSILQGHPDSRRVPGVEVSTGSLGQGLSVANGIAISGKRKGTDWRVYTMIGDGESQEGMIWEAAMLASHYCLNNTVAITDCNRLQIDGACCDVMNLEPHADKWRAFGWDVIEVDGHDISAICNALKRADEIDAPVMIIADTVKGKGVSFMENNLNFHGKAPNGEEVERALEELRERIKTI